MQGGRDPSLVGKGPPGAWKALAAPGVDAIKEPGHITISDTEGPDQRG